MRRSLFGNDAGADSVACLLATPQREMRERNEPIRQDGERFPAWMADAAADPDALVSVIVRLPESPSVADDSVVAAQRAKPRQQMQGNYRFTVVFGVWQCDKENHGWREGPPLTVAC